MYLHLIGFLSACAASVVRALRRAGDGCATHDTKTPTQPHPFIVVGNCCGFVLIPESEQANFYSGYGAVVALICGASLAACVLVFSIG
jgi:hypothetical protein